MVEDSIVEVLSAIDVVRHSDEEEESHRCEGYKYHAVLDSVEAVATSSSYNAYIVVRNSYLLVDMSITIMSTTITPIGLADDVIGRVAAMNNSTDTSLLRVGINADIITCIVITDRTVFATVFEIDPSTYSGTNRSSCCIHMFTSIT